MSLVKSPPLGFSASFSSTSSDASAVSVWNFQDEEQGPGGIESASNALAVVQAIAPLIPIPVVSSIVDSAGLVVSAAKVRMSSGI